VTRFAEPPSGALGGDMTSCHSTVIRSSGGSVKKIDVWGRRRRLAFEINNKSERPG